VEPDLVVAEGSADGLERLDAASTAWWRNRGPDLVVERTRETVGGRTERTVLPVAGGTRLALAHGVVRTLAARTSVNLVESVTNATVEPVRVLEGRVLVVDADGDGARIEARRRVISDLGATTRPVPQTDQDGRTIERHPFDATRAAEERAVIRVAPGETAEDGTGATTTVRRAER
jgi:hypothetical protein